MGEALYRTGEASEAEEWFKEALKKKPDHIPAHLTYGKMLARNVSQFHSYFPSFSVSEREKTLMSDKRRGKKKKRETKQNFHFILFFSLSLSLLHSYSFGRRVFFFIRFSKPSFLLSIALYTRRKEEKIPKQKVFLFYFLLYILQIVLYG